MAEGFDAMIDNLTKLAKHATAGAFTGAEHGADLIEGEMAATTVYRGMSGATRASTVAFAATHDDSNDSEPIGAYNTAAGRLQGFTGHNGQPELNTIAAVPEHDVWIVATVPTDYAINLVIERGDFIGDAVIGQGPAAFAAIAAGIRAGWHL